LYIKVIVDKTCSKTYVSGPIAKGRNVAIENANYDYIAVTDAGCILDESWFEEIVIPFKNENIDVVAGWYEANITNDFQEKYADIIMPKLDSVDRENFLPSSRSIAFKKECWEKVGMYPTTTYTAEDTLFDLNMKKEGFNFYFAEKAFVYWDCPFDFMEMINKQFAYGYGDGQLRINKLATIKQLVILAFPIIFLLFNKKFNFIELLIKHAVIFSNVAGYFKGLLKK